MLVGRGRGAGSVSVEEESGACSCGLVHDGHLKELSRLLCGVVVESGDGCGFGQMLCVGSRRLGFWRVGEVDDRGIPTGYRGFWKYVTSGRQVDV